MEYRRFYKQWLERAEGKRELDDGDRFISLWIAFNAWLRSEFGEDWSDRKFVDEMADHTPSKKVFLGLKKAMIFQII